MSNNMYMAAIGTGFRVIHRLHRPASLSVLLATFAGTVLVGCSTPQHREHTSSGQGYGEPLLIAHRGASGHLPEHTLEAYTAAFFTGVDMIEPDLVSTRDGYLICLHDLTLESVSDVEQRFPERQRPDGRWYAMDFDLDEIKTLTVTGRGQGWVGTQVPTLEETLLLVRRLNTAYGRDVGVVPELKKPTVHQQAGFDLVAGLKSTIESTGWASGRVIVQCFEEEPLLRFGPKESSPYPLMFNMPKEVPTNARLSEIAAFADGIGISREVIDQDPTLVKRAQERGLRVIAYTFYDEPAEVTKYLYEHRVDGLYTNFPMMAQQIRLEHAKK